MIKWFPQLWLTKFTAVVTMLIFASSLAVGCWTVTPTPTPPPVPTPTPTPTPAPFSYQVRVEAKDTGENVPNAEVTIEVGGKAPLDAITDSKGIARIFIESSYAGQPGFLIVEAIGYQRHKQNIDLVEGRLPDVVLLEVEMPGESEPPESKPVTFSYQVRVQAKDTGEYVPNAEVTIEVGGKAPLDAITDSKGIARIFIESSYAGQPGFLIVEAPAYQRHRQNIDLVEGTLPDVVPLEPTQISQVAETTTPTPEAVVVAGALNLRAGPGINYDPPVCILNYGEILDIQGRIASNEWIQVVPVSSTNTISGWVSASPKYVQINVDLNNIPIVETPPSPTTMPAPVLASAPILLEPLDGTTLDLPTRLDLAWTWDGTLGPDDYYQVEIWNRYFGFSTPIDVAWVKGTSYKYDRIEEAYDREYRWRITVVRGKPEGEKDWSTSENRVWEPSKSEPVSKESATWTLFVEPPPQPVPPPPLPDDEDDGGGTVGSDRK
jgi:hypothetical protein